MWFRANKSCECSEKEQFYIRGMAACFYNLPKEQQEKINELITEIGKTDNERRALSGAMIRCMSDEAAAYMYLVPRKRFQQMRDEFMNKYLQRVCAGYGRKI